MHGAPDGYGVGAVPGWVAVHVPQTPSGKRAEGQPLVQPLQASVVVEGRPPAGPRSGGSGLDSHFIQVRVPRHMRWEMGRTAAVFVSFVVVVPSHVPHRRCPE